MEKLKYDVQTYIYLKRVPGLAEEMKLELVNDYLDYHNHICPRCQQGMKVYQGEVKNVGSLGLGILTSIGKLVPYCVCKKCSRQMEREPEFIGRQKATEAEEYIASVVPSLNELN